MAKMLPTELQIALVDDDSGARDSLSFLLEIAGHHVSAFGSAGDFLRCCKLGELKGLILDQHMPEMTGLELANRLRRDGWRFPILLITGAPSAAITTRARELGIRKVLPKPFEEADLMAFVSCLPAPL
jgi:two-component system response regulator FixJ